MNWWRNGFDEGLPRHDVMTIVQSRGRERKLRRDGTEKKREQKKDWTKKKIKEITEAVQKLTDDEFDDLEESLRLALKSLRK